MKKLSGGNTSRLKIQRSSWNFPSVVFLILLPAVKAFSQYESPPTFHALQVIKPELLKNEVYTIAPTVKNDGYMNHFILESRFGTFTARGMPTLGTRIHELYALDVLKKEFPSTEVTSVLPRKRRKELLPHLFGASRNSPIMLAIETNSKRPFALFLGESSDSLVLLPTR